MAKKKAPAKKKSKPEIEKLPYDMADEETRAWVDADVKRQLAPKRAEKKKPIDPKVTHAKAKRTGKTIPQLGQQKVQSISPLKVLPEVVGPSQQIDMEEAENLARACGMTVEQMLSGSDQGFQTAEVARTYVKGRELVRPELVPLLPTLMRQLHNWYLKVAKEGRERLMVKVTKEHYFRDDEICIELEELWFFFNLDALDKSLVSCYCLMKIQECKKNQRGDIGFIDPYVVNDEMIRDFPNDTEDNLLMFLKAQYFCNEILFPYNFEFHWILLNIHVETGVVDVMDSMNKDPDKYKNMTTMLQKLGTGSGRTNWILRKRRCKLIGSCALSSHREKIHVDTTSTRT